MPFGVLVFLGDIKWALWLDMGQYKQVPKQCCVMIHILIWIVIEIERVHTNITITHNTKINHIMVSFSDHYNSICIDIVP